MRSVIKVSAILALATIAFASCRKDPKPNKPGNNTTKITRIEENGFITSKFEYNTDGTLKKVISAITLGSETSFTFTYNAEKKVSEYVTNNGYKSKYVYINGVLVRT